MSSDRGPIYLTLFAAMLAVMGIIIPDWAMFLLTVALCYGIVVLGMVMLVRSGLVSFGHGLYYCLGAYSAATLNPFLGITEIIIMLLVAVLITGVVSFLLGFLLRRYRDIFFAMLSLALSMILYGILSKSSTLGSTDGFNVVVKTIFGSEIQSLQFGRYWIFLTTVIIAFASCLAVHAYFKSAKGKIAKAISNNELRVEYLGASVTKIIHVNYVVSAIFAGLGGALMAVSVGHVDPEMSYWTTSGEFVFITIMGGSGSAFAPFLGSFIFTTVRSFAYEYSPETWQLLLGTVMLLIIFFLLFLDI